MEFQITDGRIFSTDENNELLAETTYVHTVDGEVDIDHTFVSIVLRGQGAAGKMMEVVANQLREKGLKATATCSYANSWLLKNKDRYADIFSEKFR